MSSPFNCFHQIDPPVLDWVHFDGPQLEGEVVGEHVLEEPLGRQLLDEDPDLVPAHKVVGKGRPHAVVLAEVVQEGGRVVSLFEERRDGIDADAGDRTVDRPQLKVEQERVQPQHGPGTRVEKHLELSW